MKKINLISILLSVILLFSATGCVNNSNNDSGDGFVTPTEHFVEGTLHEINVTENKDRIFVKDQRSDYKIISADDSVVISKATALIIENVKRATGASLSNVVYSEGMENTWSQNDKVIVMNAKAIFEKAGLVMPNVDYGVGGYYIKTLGNTVFIMCTEDEGYQLGAIKFLEETLGFDMLGREGWYYGKDGNYIPDMEIIERPDFAYRIPSNSLDMSTAYAMGFNWSSLSQASMNVTDDSGVLSPTTSGHTTYRILPPAIYCNETKPETYHPNWFWLPGSTQKEQLCYTARGAIDTAKEDAKNGVPNEYNLMVETAAEKLLRVIDENPDKWNFAYSNMDNNSACECEYCTEKKEIYGTNMGVELLFLKDLDKKIQDELQRRADETGTEKRHVIMQISAYNAYMEPPTYLDEDGNYQPLDDRLVFSDTMAIHLSPIESFYNASFYDERNMMYGESKQCLAYKALTSKMFVWLYQDNFLDYFSPYNTYDSQILNARFFYELGAMSMFQQGQLIMDEPTNFTKFKEYIDAKAYVNVNLTYREIEENFFDRYFLDAREPMYNFFKEMQTHLEYLEMTDVSVTGKIYNPLTTSDQYFSARQLRGWLEYVEQAYKLIEKYKTFKPSTYEQLRRHILIESLFPRYTLLQIYTSTFTPQEEYAEKVQFKADCAELGNVGWGEGSNGHLTNLWASWGL